MIHPIHGFLETIITILLCIPAAGIILFAGFWAIYAPIRRAFGTPEPDPVFEKSPIEALPLGAPRDGGNYVYDGSGFVHLDQADADTVRGIVKYARKAKERAARNDAEGWKVLAPETQPHHPGMHMEIMNDTDGDFDGPDDIPDDDEIERPDKSEVMVDFS
jgi:hypothetical protein